MNCLNCGGPKLKRNPKFCSRPCAAVYNNKMYPKRHWHCKKCLLEKPKPIGFNTRICDECMTRARNGTDMTLEELRTYFDGNKYFVSNYHAKIRSRARAMLIKENRLTCISCGYSKYVEACHIRPISTFAMDTLISAVNTPDNIVPLCRNCHWEYDHLVESRELNPI